MTTEPNERESDRLAALAAYAILDTPKEKAFDDLAELAARVFGVPIALVSLVDENRQWFKAEIGLGARQTRRDVSFCAHALRQDDLLVIPDARQDPRFRDNSLVTKPPHIRFCAGAQLITPEGHPLGTLCVIDRKPREFSRQDRSTLRVLARQVMTQMENRRLLDESIAARKALEELNRELALENTRKSALLGVVAQELRHPFEPIVSVADMLEHEADSIAAKCRDILLRQTEQIGRLIDDLQDASLISQGSIDLQRRPIAVPALVEQCVETVTERARRRDQRIEVSIEGLDRIFADRVRMSQILVNLLTNSVRYTPAGGRIQLIARRVDREACFDVIDNGIGIPPQDQDSLFELFSQGGQEHAQRKGLGIGLSLVRNLAAMHGGRVTVHSEGPGRGSRFTVYVPVEPNTPTS